MRAYVRRACVPAALVSVVLLTGCSSGGGSTDAAPSKSATVEAVAEDPMQEPSETPPSSAPAAPALKVGQSGEFVAVDSSDESVKTKLKVTVKSVKYVESADLDTSNAPKNGQYAVLTLTVKNVGDRPGRFSPYGAMQWMDEQTAAQDCTTLESVDGQDVDTEYQPGQSVTGGVVLDVVRKGGTVSYFDDAGEAAFTVAMPKS